MYEGQTWEHVGNGAREGTGMRLRIVNPAPMTYRVVDRGIHAIGAANRLGDGLPGSVYTAAMPELLLSEYAPV